MQPRVFARLVNRRGVKSRIAQDHHLRLGRHGRRTHQFRRQLGLPTIGNGILRGTLLVLPRQILRGIVAATQGNAEATGRQQQAHHEAVATARRRLFPVPLLLAAFALLTVAERVFRLGSLLRVVGLVQQQQPTAGLTGFMNQYQLGELAEKRPIARPAVPGEKTDHLGTVAWIDADGRSRLGGRHASQVHHEGHQKAGGVTCDYLRKTCSFQEPLDLRQRILHDNHSETPFSAGETRAGNGLNS